MPKQAVGFMVDQDPKSFADFQDGQQTTPGDVKTEMDNDKTGIIREIDRLA
ncbi:MAG: hypothetical protein P4L76_08375 [Beijerinckiaceae bacterium]|nr:hypothetical protein [Beijerinckiaceae bacterium]